MDYITFSNSVAFVSAFVSVVALIFSIRQTRYTKKSMETDRMSAVAQNSQKYVDLLTSIESRHKEDYSKISGLGGANLREIVEIFDRYDIGDGKIRHLRHLVHESSEMMFLALKGQMGWQTGANMSARLGYYKNIEYNIEAKMEWSGREDFRRNIFEKYLSEKRYNLEIDMMGDRYLFSMISEIKERLEFSKRGSLFSEVADVTNGVRDYMHSRMDEFSRSADEIKAAFARNQYEMFRLSDSSLLYRKLISEYARLDILRNISFDKINKEDAGKYTNYVSVSLYWCTILHALQEVHSWGWDV